MPEASVDVVHFPFGSPAAITQAAWSVLGSWRGSVFRNLSLLPHILEVLGGTLLGVVLSNPWKFLQYRSSKRQGDLQSAEALSRLNAKLYDQTMQLIERSERYENVRDGVVKVEIPGNELNRVQAQIDLLKDAISAGERQLAKLEKREPRSLRLNYVRPRAPTGFRILEVRSTPDDPPAGSGGGS